MPTLSLLDPTKTGKQAQELEDRLCGLVVGQDEAFGRLLVYTKPTSQGCARHGHSSGTAEKQGRYVR